MELFWFLLIVVSFVVANANSEESVERSLSQFDPTDQLVLAGSGIMGMDPVLNGSDPLFALRRALPGLIRRSRRLRRDVFMQNEPGNAPQAVRRYKQQRDQAGTAPLLDSSHQSSPVELRRRKLMAARRRRLKDADARLSPQFEEGGDDKEGAPDSEGGQMKKEENVANNDQLSKEIREAWREIKDLERQRAAARDRGTEFDELDENGNPIIHPSPDPSEHPSSTHAPDHPSIVPETIHANLTFNLRWKKYHNLSNADTMELKYETVGKDRPESLAVQIILFIVVPSVACLLLIYTAVSLYWTKCWFWKVVPPDRYYRFERFELDQDDDPTDLAPLIRRPPEPMVNPDQILDRQQDQQYDLRSVEDERPQPRARSRNRRKGRARDRQQQSPGDDGFAMTAYGYEPRGQREATPDRNYPRSPGRKR